MIKSILSIASFLIAITASAQITITQADMGQAGDSLIIGTESPTTTMSVGGTGQQTWNYTFSVDNINTMKFEYLSNTASGAYFPNSNLAIQRQADTLFFGSSSNAFVLDGIAGDGFNLGTSIRADFNPDATVMVFPSTLGTAFIDTAVFDTVVDCAAFGQGSICDSARLRRTLVSSSNINAYGTLNTSGGSYNTVRQYLIENTSDRVWIKLPFIGWQSTPFYSVDSVAYNYRWYANGEKWPVLSVIADGPAGNIVEAEFQIDNLLAYVPSQNNPLCHNDCNGSVTVVGLGADPPYSYQWSASAGSQTTSTATGLCAGTYSVTITDNDTTTYSLEVTLTNPTLVQITGSTQGVSIGGDGAIDITASGGVGSYTYAWTGPDGFTATTADLTGIDEGDYTVVVSDGNGCDTSRLFNVGLTGISSNDLSQIKLFPNPANNVLNIVTSDQISQVKVMDLLGNVVMIQSENSSSIQLSTHSLSSGIYMVEIATQKGNYLRKLTIKK